MNSPKWSVGFTCLALLLFAIVAHAGEISMDVRGMAAGLPPPASTDVPCETSEPTKDNAADAVTTIHHRQWRVASPGATDPVLAADTEITPDTGSSSAGGAASNALSVPAKPRNRWQSLVPGAIK